MVIHRIDFVDYYAKERLQLNDKTIATPEWKELLEISFLSKDMKVKILELMEIRLGMLY